MLSFWAIGSDLGNVLCDFHESIYKIVRAERNNGLAANLNHLFASLDGENIVFRQDADDISISTRFAAQIRFFRENPDIGVLGGNVIEFKGDATSFESRGMERKYPSTHKKCVAALAWGSPFAHPSVAFNLRAISGNVRYPAVSPNEDIALWFDLANRGVRFANIDAPLVYYRLARSTIARRGHQKAFSELLVYLTGIWALRGFSPHLFIPIARFVFRLLPAPIVARVYNCTNLRNFILSKR